MTGEQKQNIQDMRMQGLGYTQIAGSLGISVNTVKSFCRRNHLSMNNASKNQGSLNTGNEENKESCKQCGKRLKQCPKTKPKTFCCDKCRFDWWNAHRDRMKRRAVHRLTCSHCGRGFETYGGKNRKYCGHSCYISDRFRGEARL